MIALGVLAGVWLAGRRLEARGVGTREDMSYIALWAVPAGIIGSRLYHVITDWRPLPGSVARRVQDLGGRPRHLGRHRGSVWRSGIWAALRRGIPLQGGLSAITPGAAAGPGHRPVGELVEPGAVRAADRPAVGARGVVREGGGRRLSAGDDVPSDVPLRVAVVPVAVRRADLDRPPVPHLGHGAVRAVRRRLHVHAVLDRAAAHRRGLAAVGLAGQRGRVARRCSRSRSCTSWCSMRAPRPEPGRGRGRRPTVAEARSVEGERQVADRRRVARR